MQIEWKNIAILFCIVLILIYLPSIVKTVGMVVAEFSDAVQSSWRIGTSHGSGGNDNVASLAKLCVLVIMAVAILKMFNRRK